MMDLKSKLEKLFEPALKGLGLNLVFIQVIGTSNIKLQVIIERENREPVTIDDCVNASREMSVLLDVEDPIESSYTLEVSSPGDDRPLVKPQDFIRFIGENIKLETFEMINGSKRFKGQLIAADDINITIDVQQGEPLILRIDQLAKARLNPLKPELKSNKRRT